MKAISRIMAVGILLGALAARAALVDGIQAIVHDAVITHMDVEELTRSAVPMLERQYRGQEELFQKKLAEAEHDNLEQLIARQLIIHEFKTAYNLPESILDKDVDKDIEDRIHNQFGDRTRMIKTLQAEGITLEKYRQQIRERFIVAALRHKNVASEVIVSPHKVEVYYLAHRDEFKVEDEIKLRMIVLNNPTDPNGPQPRKLAEEILIKLKEGASFAELATIYSQGSQHKEGGDWGWWETAKLRKELVEAAAALKAGERSDIIETPDACYIMLVEEKRPAHFKSLGEVREEIEKSFLLEEQRRLEKQWVERLKKKTFYKYF